MDPKGSFKKIQRTLTVTYTLNEWSGRHPHYKGPQARYPSFSEASPNTFYKSQTLIIFKPLDSRNCIIAKLVSRMLSERSPITLSSNRVLLAFWLKETGILRSLNFHTSWYLRTFVGGRTARAMSRWPFVCGCLEAST